jgi:hypothetical protein
MPYTRRLTGCGTLGIRTIDVTMAVWLLYFIPDLSPSSP